MIENIFKDSIGNVSIEKQNDTDILADTTSSESVDSMYEGAVLCWTAPLEPQTQARTESVVTMVEDTATTLLNLFFMPGSDYYVADSKGSYRRFKQSITIDDIKKHLSGELSIGAPPTHNGQAKWIIVDIDILDHDLVKKATDILRANGLPAYATFSGQKGYHIHVFLENPVPLPEAQGISKRIQDLLKTAGIPYDKISPSPTSKGNDMCLPLGIHPKSGNQRYLLDNNLEPVREAADEFLKGIEKFQPNGQPSPETRPNPETGLIESVEFPVNISQKQCINILWRDGLQAKGTRHSATCTIANAIMRSQIPPTAREDALLSWIVKAYERAHNRGLTTSDLQYWLEEGKRLFKMYIRYNFSVTCDNPTFTNAMLSACPDELKCRLTQNKGIFDYRMLKHLKVWNASNAKPKGLGKAAQSIYEALQNIAEYNRIDTVDGIPTFSTTKQEIAALSNCNLKTVRTHLRVLIEIGLITEPPSRKYSRIGLPPVNEDLLKIILVRVRGK